MGRPKSQKPEGKTSRRTSKYSRSLTEEDLRRFGLMYVGEKRELRFIDHEIERIKKQEATKARILERRKKKKPLTKKQKEAIKLTLRDVMREISKEGEREGFDKIIHGSTSSNFRFMVREFPEQFKEVSEEPEMKPIITKILKKLGKI